MLNFIETQLFGMRWLSELTAAVLTALGADVSTRWGGSLHFFFYDLIKITLLLCTLIFVISYIQSFFPPERSRRILGRFSGAAGSFVAALLGTVTPFCSCSSIPLFIGFTAAGLPLGATFAFLISSPMVDLGSLMLLTGIFGLKLAAAYVALGLAIAVAGGMLIGKLHWEDQIEPFVRRAAFRTLPEAEVGTAERLRYAFSQTADTFRRVFPYIVIGVSIGAVIHEWIPEEWVSRILGKDSLFAVPLATLVGAPMYADIFGTVPIAEALLGKGAELGAVLSFMMSVTVLSLPSLIMLRQAVKPKLLTVFTGVCLAGILITGYLFNAISFLFV
ncbi:MAG: Permease [Burkholderia sp.]|jgi:uncharacterized membrane protein YraQ (UPF0718 family)